MLNQLSTFWASLRPQYDDDSVDRLNYLYTNLIIVAFAITVGAKQYVGEPLQCWVPAQFRGGWEAYVENYCFVENTYWLPMNENIPAAETGEREDRELKYYQWVPFVLALQALMFYVPRLMWTMLNWQSGLNVSAIVQKAFQTKKAANSKTLKGDDEFDGDIKIVAEHVRDQAGFYQASKKNGTDLHKKVTKGMGVYVTVVYLFMKLLYIINCGSQFFILNSFLGPQYSMWGIGILRDLINGRQWETSGHFPRVTLCDFEVRRLGNLHRWTVQCVLMINMVNEKIYLVLWWWFLFVLIVTVLNFLYWLTISLVPSYGTNFVTKYLRFKGLLNRHMSPLEERKVDRFTRHVLRRDGVTVLRLLSDNAGDVVTCKVIAYLWKVTNEAEKPEVGYSEDELDDDVDGKLASGFEEKLLPAE